MNELNQPLVNSTRCRHERKEARASRNEGNPTVSRCGSAASRCSQNGSNNSHVQPRRAEDRHTSQGAGGSEVEALWIYPRVSLRRSNCSFHPVALLSSIWPIVESLTVVMALCVRKTGCHEAGSISSNLIVITVPFKMKRM